MASTRSLISAAISSYIAATFAAVAVILLWTHDLETIAVGFVDPICVLPGLIAYVLATAIPRYRDWRTLMYWVLALPWPLVCFAGAVFATPGARAEGADEWALAFAIPAAVSCVACFLVLFWRIRD
jgi:hypothetical protein